MRSFFTFILLLPFLAQAQTPATTPGSAKTLNIFTLGDSNGTFPYSWPVQLKTIIPGAEVFNISRSGRTLGFVNNGDSTLNQLLTLDANLAKAASFTGNRAFDYVVIGLGTNDAKAVFADQQEQVGKSLETLISRIKNSPYPSISKARIVIISPPPYGSKAEAQAKYTGGRARVQNMSAVFKRIADKNGCLFVNGFTTPGLDMETLSADGLHMNAEGQRKLADNIAAGLK